MTTGLDETALDADPYRFERKFTSDANRSFAESVLRCHPAMFHEIYQQRWVNNIYLDTWTRESYDDNLSGSTLGRVKVRIRWYGALWCRVEKPVLELKIKHNVVNRKELYPLGPFQMSREMSAGAIRKLFQDADLPGWLRLELMNLEPSLVNRYNRKYFRNPDQAFRVTIDSALAFYATTAGRTGVDDRWAQADWTVIELKHAQDVAPRADTITQHFPFRLSRSSKYATGVELTRYRFGCPQGAVRMDAASQPRNRPV